MQSGIKGGNPLWRVKATSKGAIAGIERLAFYRLIIIVAVGGTELVDAGSAFIWPRHVHIVSSTNWPLRFAELGVSWPVCERVVISSGIL